MVFGKTKKTHSAILISLFLLLSVFFTISLTSCDNAVSSSQNEEADNTKTPAGPDKGYLRFRVTVPDGNARTALPQIDVNNIQDISITGILNGNSQNIGTWADITGMQNASISVQPGEWQLTLFARYNGFSFSSTQTVGVSVGSVSNVSFALSSNTMSGGCTIQVNFASTREAHHASYQITNLATSASAGSGNLTIQNGTSNKYVVLERNSSSPLSNGNYTVIITFYGDLAESIILNTFRETMHVQGGFVSTITRTIDLNEIFTIEYHNTEDAIVASGSLVENYSINSNYSTITFPDLSKTNNVFRGWYSSPTFDSTSRVTRLPDNSTGTQHFYAKWEPFHPLEYKIINYSNEATSTLTAAQMTSYNLPDMHDPSGPTDLSVYTMTDGESHNISCDFYYDYDSTSGCSNQITGNAIALDAIPEDRTSATTIYIKPNITHVYLDPGSGGNNENWPFDVSTPAKSVAAARKWVGTGDSYTLYVKNQISSYTDIQNLSNGPLVKRYKTVTKTLIQITSLSLNLENVIIDGGADWGTVDANASVYNLNKNGISSTGPIIGIVATTKNITVSMTNVTIQNNDNTYSSQGGLLINTSSSYTATLNLTDCIIQNCRCQGDGGGFRVLGKSNVTITGGTFAHNAALGGGVESDAGDGGAIAIMTENGASSVTANGTTFTANKAKDSGGAIFINGSTGLTTISGCTFTSNTLNNTTSGLGKTICAITSSSGTSNLKIAGANTFASDIEIFTDALAPIQVTSDTSSVSPTGNSKYQIVPRDCYTAGTPPVFNKKVLDFTGLTSAQITSVKAAFQLGGTNASNYEINDEGVIKPKAGSLIVVPGFPNLYKCGYTMTTSGSTRTIAISIKDTFDNAVNSSYISDIKLTIFDHGDVVKTITGDSVYSFTYPIYLDDPTDHTFYVEMTYKPDASSTVEYYYDFYAASGI